jgi:hypothetical protein
MSWDLLVDVIAPGKGHEDYEREMERHVVKPGDDTLPVLFRAPDAFKDRLNESDWLADEVVAAGLLTQGKQPSLLAMMTGAALVQLFRARRCKALPREFLLAVTADRVVALKMGRWSQSDGEVEVVVKVKRHELGSWPRGSVRVHDLPKKSDPDDRMLELPGEERFPVTWAGDPSTRELVELLSR